MIFHHFKELSVAENCITLESAPLSKEVKQEADRKTWKDKSCNGNAKENKVIQLGRSYRRYIHDII